MRSANAEAAWLVVVAMIWGCTNPLLKYNSKGVDRIQRNGRVSQILAEAKHLFLNWKYLLSFLANQTGSVVYYITLASADVTLAVPVTSSLTFIFTGISAWILGERNAITKETFLGLALVISGVLLCVLSKLDTEVLEKT